ncbi:MAG: GyrI-like domain-containing protein [Candidatus Nanopelagicales bacterium]
MDTPVRLVEHPGGEYAVAHFSCRPEEIAEHMGPAMGAVMRHIQTHGQAPIGAPICYYRMAGGEQDGRFELWTGFPVATATPAGDGVEPLTLPRQRIATMVHTGPYDTLSAAYEAFMAGARSLGVEIDMGTPMWEEYLNDPGEVEPAQVSTKICWPV